MLFGTSKLVTEYINRGESYDKVSKVDTVSRLYPEYYILKVNGFNRVAKSPLEEWIYYLNTGEIPSTATAPGLEEARERLKPDSMTKDELAAYYRHLDNIVILRDNINTEREEGRADRQTPAVRTTASGQFHCSEKQPCIGKCQSSG